MRAQNIEEGRAGGLITVRRAGALAPRPRPVPAALARTIEGEIIPRLMLAHQRSAEQPRGQPSVDDVVAFTDLVLHRDVDAALSRIDELERRSVGIETLLLDLMAPSARLLGDYWLSDHASFADVTIALTRLHRVLNTIAERGAEQETVGTRSALLAPVEREQHTFGLSIVATLLTRAGWSTRHEVDPAGALRAVRHTRFDIVGLSASCEARLDGLAARISAIRRTSRNPDVCVLVGGPLFVARPDLASAIGADATALDARATCRVAEELVAKQGRRS